MSAKQTSKTVGKHRLNLSLPVVLFDELRIKRKERFDCNGFSDYVGKQGIGKRLNTEGVALRSLQESIDTTTATGKLIFHVFGALAEFERNLILERTQAGLSAARARGRLGGRPKHFIKEKTNQADRLRKLNQVEIYQMELFEGTTSLKLLNKGDSDTPKIED